MKFYQTAIHVQLFLEAVDGRTDIDELIYHFQDLHIIAHGINAYNEYATNKFYIK